MSIKRIKQYFQNVVGLLPDVDFDYGADFDNDIEGKYTYPMVFMEISPTERTVNTNGTVSFTFAFQVLQQHKDEDKGDILDAQMDTERLLDAINNFLTYEAERNNFFPNVGLFRLLGPAVSVSYATDSIAAGWRQEVECFVEGERCDYRDAFGINPNTGGGE